MVVAVGDDQPPLRIELDRVRRAELARARAGLADDPQELAVAVEDRDPPDEFRIGFRGAVAPGTEFLACPAWPVAFAPPDIPLLVLGETAVAPPVIGCVL